jgi:tRNA modification GTPase
VSGLSTKHDAIAAVATASGKGAVGIVRLSGPALAPLLPALVGRTLKPRHAHHGPFLDANGQAIDQGLALWFPAPHSYTGEDVLELQAHGGPVVLQLLLARCLQAAASAGLAMRLAEPGEFTQRAFLNDKLDLAQAEAVADLIDASTEAAARSATRSLAGAFSQAVASLAERLLELRMLVEATLDFPEEEIDFLEQAQARQRLAAVAHELAGVLTQSRQGALLREGLRVVLAGQPNVGKSSLLNALAGAELAIVTPVAGTTRDRIDSQVQIDGVPLHLTDTAGLREEHEAADEVERIGMARTWAAVAAADVLVHLHDLTRWPQAKYQQAEAALHARISAELPAHAVRLLVFNKADATTGAEGLPDGALCLSARSGQGLPALRQALLEAAGWQPQAEGVFMARTRHVLALQEAAVHVASAQAHAAQRDAVLDLLAEDLRLAHDALGRITGRVSADDLLGVIFSRFCIGK